MTDHVQSVEELEFHLQDQLRFLQASADAFDGGFEGGFEGEAKRIAVSIRVLVHDTQNSKSLLGQLGRKIRPFIDTALPITPGNKVAHSGLVVTSIVPGVGATYVAFLDDGFAGKGIAKDFEDWWNATVFVDSNQRELSRKGLVLAVANKDGGAHVDSSLDAAYADLSRNNSLGWTYTEGPKSEPMGGPERAAMRQIGHEVLKSLIPGYSKAAAYPAGGVLAGGVVMLAGEQATQHQQALLRARPAASVTQKVGRNQPCPCGSGSKFKRCCGARC
jgi:hypothetical protein